MTFHKLTNSSSPGASCRRPSFCRVLIPAALTLMCVSALLFTGTMTGLAKDKTPQTRVVSGQVMDGADNGIVGASVELKDLQTGKVLDIYSQDGGRYQFAGLRFDHDYTVQANYKGLYSESRQVSSLETRTPLVLNLTIAKTNP